MAYSKDFRCLEKRLIAPMLFEGTCNTILFNEWLKHFLLPEL